MNLKNILKSVSLLMLGALAYGGSAYAGAVPVGPDWRYLVKEGATVTAQVDEVVYDGARAQVLRILATEGSLIESQSRLPGNVKQAFSARLTPDSALTFKARFDVRGKVQPALLIHLQGRGLSVSRRFTPAEAQEPAKDGFYTFRWAIQPKEKTPGQLLVETITLIPEIPVYGSGDQLTVEVIDMTFDNAEPLKKHAKPAVEPAKWIRQEPVSYRDVPVKGWTVEKPEASPVITIEETTVVLDGKSLPALNLRYRKGTKPSAVALPLKANIDIENVLTFKAKVQAPEGTKRLLNVEAPLTGWYSYQFNAFTDNFGVGFQDSDGFKWTSAGVPTTHFLQHLDKTQPEVDGFKTFLWDVKNDNRTGNKGFDLQRVSQMLVYYDNKSIPDGQETVITIVHPQLVTGLVHMDGDTNRFAQFQNEMAAYKPDYSDSTHYLGAPAKGRLPHPLPFVKNGESLGEIVGKPSVWSPEGNGVRELYQWMFRLTGGTQVPVLAKPSNKQNTKVFIGTEYAQTDFAADIEALKGSDGSAIRTKGNNIYLFGATGKGTLNAVYAFLEGNTDIIWPHPSQTFEAIYSQSPNLDIQWGDYLHRTPARYWGWMGKTTGPQFDYQVRNRANYLGLRSTLDFKYWGLYMEEGGGHNLHSWIPFALFKTNPEYWAQIDGKRQAPNAYKNQICLANPQGRKIFMENLRAAIEKSPQAREANCYNLKIEDNWGVCQCEECTRPIRLPDGTILKPDDIAFRSTQFFMFLNSVANYLHNRGLPRMQIGTYVYFYTVPVPKVPVTQFLRPYFCDYVRKDHKMPIYAPMNALWWRIVNEWTAINDSVVIREYTGLYVNFRPLADVAAYDIKALLDAGVKEFTSESLGEDSSESPTPSVQGMHAAAMEFWVITRLYWDPTADVQQLRKYYIRRSFREAAPHIEKFYGVLREVYYAEKRTSDFEENQELLRCVIRLGKEGELRTYLDSALADVKHPLSRMMVKSLIAQYDTQLAQARVLQP